MTKDVPVDCEDLAEMRRAIDAMKDAFANAIEARQAELRARETSGPRAGWMKMVIHAPR